MVSSSVRKKTSSTSTSISSSTPVASAQGGGFITAGGTIVRQSIPEAGFQTNFQTSSTRRGAEGQRAKQLQTLAPTQSFPTGDTSGQTIQKQFSVIAPASEIGDPTQFVGGRAVRKSDPRFDRELFRKAGREFFFIEGTPISGIGTLASPLQRFVPKTTGSLAFGGAVFGTVSAQALPRGAGGREQTTEFQILERQATLDPSLLIPSEQRAIDLSRRVSKEVSSPLQQRIETGEINVSQAEKEFEKQFGTRFEERRGELSSGVGFRQRVGRTQQPVIDTRQFGEFVGVVGLSVTPAGTALLGSSFVASGLPDLTGGDTFRQRALGGVKIGAGLLGGGLAVRQAEVIADVSLIRELQSQQAIIDPVFSRELIRTDKGSLFQIRTQRQFGTEARLTTELKVPVFNIKQADIFAPSEGGIPTLIQRGDQFSAITGGRGITSTKIFSTARGEFITSRQTFGFQVPRIQTSGGLPRLGGKDLVRDLEGFQGSFGVGLITRPGKDTFTQFGFGGVSKQLQTDFGTVNLVRGGSLKGFRFPLFDTPKGIFRVQEKGFIRGLSSKDIGGGVDFIRPAKIRKTPLSQTFGQPSVSLTGLSSGLEKQIVSPRQLFKTPKVSTRGSLVGIPRSVGGQGLTQEQLATQTGSGFFSPRSRGALDFRQDLATLPSLSSTLRFNQASGLKLSSSLGSSFLPKQATAPKSAFRQRERLDQPFKQQFISPTISPSLGKGFADFGFGGFPPIIPFPGFGSSRRGRLRKRGTRTSVRISPSLTGIIGEFKGLPETTKIGGVDIGILPGQIRGVPRKKKKKSKKKR